MTEPIAYIDCLDNPRAFTPGTTEQAIAYYLSSYAVQLTIKHGRAMGYRRVFDVAARRQAFFDAIFRNDTRA